MNKLLLINVSANSGSTGRIAEEIGQTAMQHGYESYFAYGRTGRDSQSNLIRIGNGFDIKLHGLESRLFDNHGFSSRRATKRFIEEIERIKPDVVNLHNVHGYYLNVEILFNYLAEKNIPVVWTLHDCWPFTGHCAHFMRIGCEKWKTACRHCENISRYPTSWMDNSARNFQKKKALFTRLQNLTFVSPCQWMADCLGNSFLKDYPSKVIYNGTDLDVFKPYSVDKLSVLKETYGLNEKKIVLGVTNVWQQAKGWNDIMELSKMLPEDFRIVMIGLTDQQLSALPENTIGLKRTENVHELAKWYSLANVYINPTYVDNFPTTNIEALACGTPVATYNTGGSPEAIDEKTGIIVEQGNIHQLRLAIENLANRKETCSAECRKRAEMCFDKKERFEDYVGLFDELIKNYESRI